MLKAILFDLDNTLLDFLYFKIETAKAAAKAMVKHGLPVDEQKAYGLIFSVYEEKGIEYQKTFYEVVKPFGLEVNTAEKIQQAGITAYLKRKFEVLRPYPMVKPTLDTLRKRHKLAIVTDAPRNKAWQRLVITGLEDEFDIVVTHDDTKRLKPHPSPFQLATEKLGVLPSGCLFVGDNAERDIAGAKEVGMLTCMAKYGAWDRKAGPKADYDIKSFEELVRLAERLDSG